MRPVFPPVEGNDWLGLTDATQSVAWVAHLGGYLAGILTIPVFDRFTFGAKTARPA